MGRVDKGFNFLGYHFKPDVLTINTISIARCVTKLLRLFEQGASVKRCIEYCQRWIKYALAALKKQLTTLNVSPLSEPLALYANQVQKGNEESKNALRLPFKALLTSFFHDAIDGCTESA